MPLLVMSKLCIEKSPRADTDSGKCGSRVEHRTARETAAFSLVRQQLESLNVDNMMLRRAVEDLRVEIRSSSSNSNERRGDVEPEAEAILDITAMCAPMRIPGQRTSMDNGPMPVLKMLEEILSPCTSELCYE